MSVGMVKTKHLTKHDLVEYLKNNYEEYESVGVLVEVAEHYDSEVNQVFVFANKVDI